MIWKEGLIMNDIKNILMSKFFQKNLTDKALNKSSYQDEIRLVTAQLACLDTWFQIEEDSDLVEACIYQRESLNARYRYLIRKAKETNVSLASLT